MKTEYWTVFGKAHYVCSKHRTLRAAERNAASCEKRGGTKHHIYKVQRIKKADEQGS